jgi:hypothetical protein
MTCESTSGTGEADGSHVVPTGQSHGRQRVEIEEASHVARLVPMIGTEDESESALSTAIAAGVAAPGCGPCRDARDTVNVEMRGTTQTGPVSSCVTSGPPSPAATPGSREAAVDARAGGCASTRHARSSGSQESTNDSDMMDIIEEEELYRSLAENDMALVPYGVSLERHIARIIFRYVHMA